MYTKAALLAFIGSAAAFNAPMMVSRRDAVATGAAAAVVAPLLRPSEVEAKAQSTKAPFITMYDERDGCTAQGTTKTIDNFNNPEKGLCIKVQMKKVTFGENGDDRLGAMARDVFTNYEKRRGEGPA